MNINVFNLAATLGTIKNKTLSQRREDANRLTHYASALHTFAEDYRSHPAGAQQDKRFETAQRKAAAILERYGLEPVFNMDPRGAAIKLKNVPEGWDWEWVDFHGSAYIPEKA